MSILPLIIAPDPVLQKTSLEVEKVDANIQKLMDDMLETMYAEHGVGLSAVQVGVLKRVVVMDVEYKTEECGGDHHHHHHHDHIKDAKPLFMVNPKILKCSPEHSIYFEGCLSFPDARADVERPKLVTVEYLDYHGQKQTLSADELLATCVQHEIDHLNGITFVDHISKLKKEMIMKKMKKLHKR
jgi:peptide deformylase